MSSSSASLCIVCLRNGCSRTTGRVPGRLVVSSARPSGSCASPLRRISKYSFGPFQASRIAHAGPRPDPCPPGRPWPGRSGTDCRRANKDRRPCSMMTSFPYPLYQSAKATCPSLTARTVSPSRAPISMPRRKTMVLNWGWRCIPKRVSTCPSTGQGNRIRAGGRRAALRRLLPGRPARLAPPA